MDLKVQNLLRKFDSAYAVANSWRSTLDVAYRYVQPNRNTFYYTTPGQQKDVEIYDTTAVFAARSFALKIHNALTPAFIQWADLVAGSRLTGAARDSINKELQVITEVLFGFINSSNLPLALSENYMDLAMGTAVLKIDEGTDETPFICTAIPISEVSFEEDALGILDNCYRKFCIKGYEIRELWPKAKLPFDLANEIEKDDTKEVTLMEMTRVTDRDGGQKEYTYTVIESSTNTIIYENSEPSSCWIPFRWGKASGDIFGRGPGIEVLSTVKRLNQMIEFELIAGALKICPPFLSYNGNELNASNFRIRPNALIPVSVVPGTGRPLEQLIVNPDVRYSEAKAADYRQQINKAFYSDPFGPIETPAKTATEILERQQQLMEEMAPISGRLQTEFLRRVIARCIYILVKKGLIPSLQVDGNIVSVQYKSILARTQAQAEVMNFQQMHRVMSGIVGPELALLGIKPEELPLWLAERFGVDLELVKSPFELQQMQQQVMQLAQQQQIQQLPTQQA